MVTKHIPNAVWNQMGLIFSEHSDRHSLGKHLLEVTRITNSSSGIDYPGISLWEQSIRQTLDSLSQVMIAILTMIQNKEN